MKNVLYRFITCLAFLSQLFICTYAQAVVTVEASLEPDTEDGPQLIFTLKNTGAERVKIHQGLLPWNRFILNGLTLIAVEAGVERKQLQGNWPLINPIGYIELEPNQYHQGKLLLSRQFHDLRQQLEKNDIILFWSYTPKKSSHIEI